MKTDRHGKVLIVISLHVITLFCILLRQPEPAPDGELMLLYASIESQKYVCITIISM